MWSIKSGAICWCVGERENNTVGKFYFRVALGLAFVAVTHSPRLLSAQESCIGDCNANGRVQINELIIGVSIALSRSTIDECPVFDGNDSGGVEINELIQAVRAALEGCDEFLRTEPLKDDVVFPLPPLSIDPPRPGASSMIDLRVSDPGAQELMLEAAGDGCGELSMLDVSGGDVQTSVQIGEFGRCQIRVVDSDGVVFHETEFEVEPAEVLLPEVEAVGGVFVPGELPQPTRSGDEPNIAKIDAPGAIINGGTVELRIEVDDLSKLDDVRQALVQVPSAEGFEGYFTAPVAREGNVLIVELRLDSDVSPGGERAAAFLSGLPDNTLDVFLSLVDRFGNIGEAFRLTLDAVLVGSGEVQVSLSWDTATDLDLHVVSPNGIELYWGRRSGDGGALDLDSNAGCGIDGVNNENINWPTENAPRGEYIVRVNFWSDCEDLPANYVVTARVCGETKTFRGSFAAGTDRGGGLGSGIEVARIDNDCVRRVRGRAVYEDLKQTTTGLAAMPTELPIRFADVEVQRVEDGFKLGEGDTKQDGSFDLFFMPPGPSGYRVVVLTRQDNRVVKQTVRNDQNEIYAIASEDFEESAPDQTDLRLVAATDEAGPAFNIFDVGVKGGALVRSTHGKVPPALSWLWTAGKKGSCGANVSCFDGGLISVLSIAADPDEYDDLVLLHEYGHFWQSEFSGDDSPGGSHSSSNRVDPRLAWGEGSATFFGNLAGATSLYLDTVAGGIGVSLDIETLSSNVPSGTTGNMLNGNLSEAVVAAVLWDLADGTNEMGETLSSRTAVFDAASYLKAPAQDRGVNGVDLIDFVDGWFCRGHGDRGDMNSGVEGIVVGLHKVPYDFPMIAPCAE